MAENSNIEWTDASWNCLAGCEAVSPGCANCYAATMTRRLEAMGNKDYAGLTTAKHFNGKVRCLPDKLDIPLRWKKPRPPIPPHGGPLPMNRLNQAAASCALDGGTRRVPYPVRIRPGLYSIAGIKCACGGELRVERRPGERRDFQWETFCQECKTCDPNGWPALRDCVANAAACFGEKRA